MTALVCPSCRCKLKAPEKMAGRTAPCPKCRTAVVVPFVKKVGVALSDSKTHPLVLPAASADTVESMSLESTAVHTPVKVAAADEEPGRARKAGPRLLLRGLGAVALAAAAAFALWMALDSGR
jgi:hypothetical protein